MIDSKNEYQVPAVVRAVAVLDYLGHTGRKQAFATIHKDLGSSKEQCIGPAENAGRSGNPAASSNGFYTLGLRLFELGTLAVRRMDIRKEALPHMRALVDKVRLAGPATSASSTARKVFIWSRWNATRPWSSIPGRKARQPAFVGPGQKPAYRC